MRTETVWLNGFENGETQLFNSGGVVKWAYFQNKWSNNFFQFDRPL